MKIAIASEGSTVSQHFGHCDGFTIYDVEGKEIKGDAFIANPGHRPGFLPNYLYEQGISVIIAGGMGAGAVAIFNEKGIDIVTGAAGNVKDAVNAYLAGTLKSSESICNQHQHADECGGHSF